MFFVVCFTGRLGVLLDVGVCLASDRIIGVRQIFEEGEQEKRQMS